MSNERIGEPIQDSRAYLWLAIATLFGVFSFGRWTIALAPWLHVLFSLRFLHTQPTLRGYIILSIVSMANGAVLVWQGVLPSFFAPEILYTMIVVGALVDKLPYLARSTVVHSV